MTNIEKITEVLKECYKTEVFKDSEESILQTATAIDKAGYRKQSDVAREFAEKACNRMDNYGVPLAIKQIQGEIRSVAKEYGVEEK